MNIDNYQMVALAFDGKDSAQKALEKIKKLRKNGGIKYKDAVAVYKNDKGKVKLVQTKEKKGILGGGIAGLLVGLLLGGPIVAAAIGALVGGQIWKGMSNKDLKEIGEELKPDESALFIVVEQADWDKLEEAIPNYKALLYREVVPVEVVIGLEKAQDNHEMANAVDEELTE